MHILAVCLALLALFLLLLLLVYRKTFYAGRRKMSPYGMPHGMPEMGEKTRELVAALEARPAERIVITAHDGTRLSARYHHVRDGAPLQIQCHGYRGHASRDFCGGNPLAASLGHNTLLIDQRAHGESGGHTITFGIRERFDILDWISYARGRFGEVPIILVGISMGGASVLMASGEPLPATVSGVIADCPYSSPREIICSVIRRMHLSPRLAYPLVSIAARLFGRFSLSECTALEAVTRADIPILLLHGEEDGLVPVEMSQRIAEAGGARVRLVTFPGADHGMSYVVDPVRYGDAVSCFLNDCLTAGEKGQDL